MRITRLKIEDFKNLKKLDLAPDPSEMTSVLIGQNATGKSNLIEALVEIFRHLDLGEAPPQNLQNYELEYICRENKIQIKSKNGRLTINVLHDGENKQSRIGRKKFAEEAELYLPRNIFAYYSGRIDRLEKLFYDHQKQQYKDFRGEAKWFKSAYGDSSLVSSDTLLRRLFYCRNEHSQLILLSYLIELERDSTKQSQERLPDILKEYLGIEGIESALFVLKKPQEKPTDIMSTKGDERFWYAAGVIEEFLDMLWTYSLAPIDDDLEKIVDFRGHKSKQDTLYLYLDKERLIKAAEEIGDTIHFFRQLEGVFMADYLDEVRIQVNRTGVHEPLFFSELSEGEQQLMTVLGLIQFTRDEESLFLLDEPDTHINPIWKYNYFGMIDKLLGHNTDRREKNQLFLTTHDPLMLGSLKKEQVRVMSMGVDRINIDMPIQDPRGMGYSGLLRSEMFGMRSSIDPETLNDLDRRNQLISKRADIGLDAAETTELKVLSERLDELGYSIETKDPLYQLFIEKLYAQKKRPLKNVFTQQQLREQTAIADKIVQVVIHEEKIGELSDLARELKIELETEE